MSQRQSDQAIARTLHSARLSTYLQETGDDLNQALRLYRWNLALASAFQEVLSVTEIALRNALDLGLGAWNAQQINPATGLPYSQDWLIETARPLNSLISRARSTASVQAHAARASRPAGHPRKTSPINHHDLLAQLTFGIYAKLLPTQDPGDKHFTARQILWQQALKPAFPHLASDPEGHVLSDRVHRLQALRNRVSHMEPLLGINIAARQTDALKVIAAVDLSTRDWCASISRIREVQRARPDSVSCGSKAVLS